MKKALHVFFVGIFTFYTINAGAQGLAVNTTGAAANASAMLDVSSTTQGMLVPRMNNSQMNGIGSAATGLLIYCTDCSPIGFYYYSGSAWTSLNALLNVTTQGNTFNGASQLVKLDGTTKLPAIDGSQLTNLDAGHITSGTVPTANLGSGTASSTTFLSGNNTWQAVTASSKIVISGSVAEINGATEYYGFPASSTEATTNIFGTPMPAAMTITALYITATVRISGTVSNQHTVTILKNGNATTLTTNCTSAASAAVGSQVSANVSGSLSVSAGDILSIKLDQTAPATGPQGSVGISVLAQ